MATMSSPVPPGETAASAVGELLDDRRAGPAALRGGALRSGSYALSIGLGLLSAPLLIRHLGLATFGRYSAVLAIVTIVGGITDAGLFNIGLREWAAKRGEQRTQTMRDLLGLRLELSAAGVIVGTAFVAVAGYGHTLVLGTLLAGCGMVTQSTANFLTVGLQGDMRFGWTSALDLIRQTVTVAAIVVLVVAGVGLLWFLAVPIVTGVVVAAVTAVLVRGRMPRIPTLRGRRRWAMLRDTIPYAAAIALNTLYFRVTIVIMSLASSARQTGYFATSFRVTEILVGIPALAVGAAFPILARAAGADSDRFAHATRRILELALIVGAVFVLSVVLIAPFAIEVLAGHAGAPAAPVLQIQGLTLIATFLSLASGFALLSLRRHVALLVANCDALTANIVLTLVLIPVAQARGAAAAAAIAEGCLAAGQLALLGRASGIRLSGAAIRPVALASAAGALPLLAPIHPVLRTVAGLSLFTCVLALQRAFPPELMQLIGARRSLR